MLRHLLVHQVADCSLDPFGEDAALRRRGGETAERRGENARKRTVMAVGGKPRVLLRRRWVGYVY